MSQELLTAPAPVQTQARLTSRPIFILGVDRSGTSLLSEITYNWGAYAGNLDLLAEGNEGNPQGYWEYEPMEKFVSKLFSATKVSHWNPHFPQRLRECAADSALRDEALALFASMEKVGFPAWFWKEPYLCLCLPFFTEVLVDPIYIITVRNPYESALSYEKFMLPPMLHGTVRLRALFLIRWQHFMMTILEHLATHPGTIYIPYSQLMKKPKEQCERLCDFLDRECQIETGDAAKLRKMHQVVNPELWRNRSEISLAEIEQATEPQRELYQHLLGREKEPRAAFDPKLYPMDGWWREYLENVDLMLGLLNIE